MKEKSWEAIFLLYFFPNSGVTYEVSSLYPFLYTPNTNAGNLNVWPVKPN